MTLANIDFEQIVLGYSLKAWLSALVVIIAGYILIRLIQRLATRRLAHLESLSENPWYGALLGGIRRCKSLLLFLVVLYAGLRFLEPPASVDKWITAIAVIAIILQVGFWADGSIIYGFKRYELSHGGDPSRLTTMRAASVVLRLFIWAIVILLALDNIPGVHITALVASLGIGGIAVALALQNILGDLFASLSIVLDKPFVVGDFIIVDTYMGTVEKVGLKTTRIRSLSGEQVIVANNDLLKSRIRNYKRMEERRVVFSLGVIYQTPPEKLEVVPGIIRGIIEAQEHTRFDRAHFSAYGESSLNFEVVYYVLSSDYNVYMNIQQAINLAIYRRFEQEGMEFAYPTRTLFVNKEKAQ